MGKCRIAFIGLGNRGLDTYMPEFAKQNVRCEIVAVADSRPERLNYAREKYGISAASCFDSAEALLSENKIADALVIATQDRQHVLHALPALEKGYDLLLEKPVSPSLEDCRSLLAASHRTGRRVVVCHVLRYTPFYRKTKELIDQGLIGDIAGIMAIENVGYWHMAHSFVRGNWRNSLETSPMILQKCCHDMDLYLWLAGKRCRTVSSFGSTFLFKSKAAPAGAALRCLDGCRVKDACPFDCEKIYITDERTGIRHGHTGWPNEVLTAEPTEEKLYQALRQGPYGRCVYACDNNVVDHQVVNLEMTDGSNMSFTMSGFTAENTRYAKFMGTLGEITGDLHSNTICLHRFGKAAQTIRVDLEASSASGHAGGDQALVADFLDLMDGRDMSGSGITSLDVSLDSHFIALAAERSRLNGGAAVDPFRADAD